MTATRIRLSRSPGWRMPPNSQSVARPHKFGNPFPSDGTARGNTEAVAKFRQWIALPEQAALVEHVKRELRGKNLACWCPLDLPCHADVLLEIANA